MSSLFGCHHKPVCFPAKSKQWAKLNELLSISKFQLPGESSFLMSKASSRSWGCQSGLWTVIMRTETEQEGRLGLGEPSERQTHRGRLETGTQGLLLLLSHNGKSILFFLISYFQSTKWGWVPAIYVYSPTSGGSVVASPGKGTTQPKHEIWVYETKPSVVRVRLCMEHIVHRMSSLLLRHLFFLSIKIVFCMFVYIWCKQISWFRIQKVQKGKRKK